MANKVNNRELSLNGQQSEQQRTQSEWQTDKEELNG